MKKGWSIIQAFAVGSSASIVEDCSSSAFERDGDLKTKKGVKKLKKQKFCSLNPSSCNKCTRTTFIIELIKKLI